MSNEKKIKILIAVPTMGSVHPNLVARLIKWAKDWDKGVINFYFTYRMSPVERARNQCVNYFFNGNGTKKVDREFTHLFFIDSDTIPPVDALKNLLSEDKDVVTGLTPMLQFDEEKQKWSTMHNAFIRKYKENGEIDRTETPPLDKKMHKIDRCGSSCILIKREVFEKMKKPWYEFTLTEDGLEHKISEDIKFCDKAKELGFEIWADTRVECQHFKSIML